MFLRQIFDPWLAQYAYLIGCQKTGEALIIDPERDIDRYQTLARENDLEITAVAETHIHADFVSGAQEFAANPEVRLYLPGEGGPDWSYRGPSGRSNTHILHHGNRFEIGSVKVEVLHTPGHTPEHVSFLITDAGSGATEPLALVTGDFLFVGDVGRPDLLETAVAMAGTREPAARALGESLRERLAPLGDYLQIFPAHGAGSSCGKALSALPGSTLGYERRTNRALRLAQRNLENFVADILSGQPEPAPYFARMKRVNRDGIGVAGRPIALPRLDAIALTQPGIRIVDTRADRAAFMRAHVPGSLHAPLHSPLFMSGVGSYLDENDSIILVLQTAYDAGLAARQLFRIGFDRLVGWIPAHEAPLTAQIKRFDFVSFEAMESDGAVIDVRSGAEFAAGHLVGAQSFPFTRLKSTLDALPKNRRLFVHCGAGRRSALATSFLAAHEFDVVHVDGGRPEWR